jgi:hypothetical protein
MVQVLMKEIGGRARSMVRACAYMQMVHSIMEIGAMTGSTARA